MLEIITERMGWDGMGWDGMGWDGMGGDRIVFGQLAGCDVR